MSLWLTPQKDRVQGISLLYQSQIRWLKSSAVILATGGGGQVFTQTTNPKVSTGDGVALAWRAGAVLRDLEFFQFHPTALTKPGAPHFLISEAVRGEGAHLIDDRDYRFAFEYHPAGELAPRDVVSRAIFHHLHKTAANPTHAHVYLDLRPIDPDRIRYRFPNIINVCKQWGIDVFHEPIPVAPAAHYWMGGVACDLMSQTSIHGLYAIGETASTGVHGANRLDKKKIEQLREQLIKDDPEALVAVDVIEEYQGNLADAAKAIAIRNDIEGIADYGLSDWFLEMLQECRDFICQPKYQNLRENYLPALIPPLADCLAGSLGCLPGVAAIIAVPFAAYIKEEGMEKFCKSPNSQPSSPVATKAAQ